MPIEVTCGCGRNFAVHEAQAGRKGKCPSCGSLVWIAAPGQRDAEETVDTMERPVPPSLSPPDPSVQKVHLVDAEMPFGSMCWLVFKWTMAAIPTMLLLWFVSWLIRLIK